MTPQYVFGDLFRSIGRCGRDIFYRHNASHFHLSFGCLVCFLRKSTEFHDMRTGCQIILIHLLLLIFHKSVVCANSVALFDKAPQYLSLCYLGDCIHK